jgi:hypothetical protein
MRTGLLLSAIAVWGCQAPLRAQSSSLDPGGTWAFEPSPDDFRADALLDLRFLNEKIAGESGFVKTTPEGGFALGNGKPVRFWAVNSGTAHEKNFSPRPLGRKTAPSLDRHAKFLAKRGVNMARLHLQMSPKPEQALDQINPDERDYAWRAVAAFKKEGIYTTLSPYWGVPMKFSESWNFPGGTQQSALGLLFFDPTLQKAYKSWLKQLLTEKNPYTGIPLAQDPSLAIFQIQNEDSLLFWTVNNIQGVQRDRLETLFGTFLKRKYGSVEKIAEAWQGDRAERDNPAAGRFETLNIWELTQVRSGGRRTRIDDQCEFLTRTMFEFNQEIIRYMREELGCKQLVNAGNWRTADTIRLNDAERWSYTAGEVDAVNRYFGGVHKGPHEGWAIVDGDQFTSPSALLDPRPLPTNLRQTKGRPILITESSWVMPMNFAAEGPFLIAATQSLTGVDAFFWFATGDDEWTPPQSANGYLPSQAKWTFANPEMLGTFPANAYLWRTGALKEGQPVVQEHRSLNDVFQRRTPLIAEESGFDPNRDSGDIAPTSSVKTGVEALAFLVGPSFVTFESNANKTSVASIAGNIDKANGIIKSNTGEIVWNTQKGWCTIDAPKAQGVAAHFGNQQLVRLTDVTFSSRNVFGSAVAVSMDENPISTSKKVLVQYMTEARPTGWRQDSAQIALEGGKTTPGFVVKSFGKAPWQIVNPALDVIVKNKLIKKATALDANGNAMATVPLTPAEGGVRFSFPAKTLYVVLTP